MALVNLQATIPFPCATLDMATALAHRMAQEDILVDTRGDRIQIVQAHPEDFENNRWYVVIHTGNICGMIHDLREAHYL
jgi:hypothetical protein